MRQDLGSVRDGLGNAAPAGQDGRRLCAGGSGRYLLIPWQRALRLLFFVPVALGMIAVENRGTAQADGPARNGITVTAEGSATLPPDIARISGNVDTSSNTAADALQQNDDTLNAVVAAIKALGATDAGIKTTGVRIDPVTSPAGAVTGYQARNGLTLRTTDLTQIGALIQAMIGAGISNVNAIDYALQDPDQLQLLAVQSAIANARRRAEVIAASLGVGVGASLNFSFGATNATPAPPPPQPAPTVRAVAAAPPLASPPPVLPTSFSATSQVTVTFAIITP